MIELSTSIQLGTWNVCVIASSDTQASLKNFIEQFQAFSIRRPQQDEKSRYLLLISPKILEENFLPSCLAADDRIEWKAFYSALLIGYRQFLQQRVENATKTNRAFVFLWPPQNQNKGSDIQNTREKRFLAFSIENPKEEAAYLKIFGYMIFLANTWHIERGGLCVHSAAVSRNGQGFLFLGDSGAGKSTTARLSVEAGCLALGDDLNFILSHEKHGYSLAASPSPILSSVGYSMIQPGLQGIFTLVQDKKDYLVSLSPKQTAIALFDSFQKQTPYTRRFSDQLVKKAFHTIADIARCVPAYELYFRKTPDFWKQIHEKFPG